MTDEQLAARLRDCIRDGDTIAWGQADGQPRRLTRVLAETRQAWHRLRLFLGIGHDNVLTPAHADVFDFVSYCATGSNRALVGAGVLDILASHYSQLPAMIRNGALRVDVAMLRISPADECGRHSLGLANDYISAAATHARVRIAEIDPAVPWTHGEQSFHRDDFDVVIDADLPGHRVASSVKPATEAERSIADRIAALVEDGSTLQVGIGKLPDTVLAALQDRRDLGFHSGAAGDGFLDLVQRGVITNARKPIDTGISVAGVLIGSEALHRYAHRNPTLRLRGADYTHAPEVLASLPRFVALNAALEVDLSGQVNSESIDGTYMGALGGIADFQRGALASPGGLPIVALASIGAGRSRIVERLSGPASISAGDAGVVVTEFGVADLRGLTLRQRRERLVAVSHPAFRASLAG